MYDVNYLLDAIQGWRNEHADDPTRGLEELMEIIKREDVYGRDIVQLENIEFLKHFQKYAEAQGIPGGCAVQEDAKSDNDADKFQHVGEAATQDLASRFSERIDVITAKQKLMAGYRLTTHHVDVMLHVLGHPRYYRGYFAADEGSRDWDDLRVLVQAGMIEPYKSKDHDSRLRYFRVTEHGKQCLRDAGFVVQSILVRS